MWMAIRSRFPRLQISRQALGRSTSTRLRFLTPQRPWTPTPTITGVCAAGLVPHPPDPNDFYGAWTSSWSLYTSLDLVGPLILPTDGSTIDSLRPLFTWTGVTNAHAYSLQVAKDIYFSGSSVIFSATISIPSGDTVPPSSYQKTSSDLPRNRTLYWRVRDQGKYGWSDYSDYFTLYTGNPPSAPSLQLPTNKKIMTDPDDVYLQWSVPAGAVKFHLQISTVSDFSTTVVDDDTITVNNYDAALDSNNKYSWRVSAGNGVPTWSNWSSTYTFYTTPPDPAGLVTPPSPINSLTPTFDWNVIPEASSYWIQIFKFTSTCTSTKVLDKKITVSPPYTLTTTLPRNATLCWRVSAGGLFGFSGWTLATDTPNFQTPDPPYAPNLTKPANASTVGTFAPLLDWASSLNQNSSTRFVDDYQVQVSSSPSFTSTVIDTIVPVVTQLQLGPMDLAEAGTYSWRVRAHNISGDLYSSWSSTWSFTTPPQFEGTIYDAMTENPGPPDPVQSVNLQISGTSWSTMTDSSGNFSFRGLPPGTYDLLISKGNYIRQTRTISISKGNNIEQDFDIVLIPDPGKIRIQLVWGSTISDMESNLWLPKINECLVNKDNLDGGLGVNPCASPANAELVAQDTQAYGTEVVTIDSLYGTTDTDQYLFAVFLNDAASKMGGSQARVTVYYGTDLEGTYNVPTSSNGTWWKVLKIKQGSTEPIVTAVNTVGSTSPAPY